MKEPRRLVPRLLGRLRGLFVGAVLLPTLMGGNVLQSMSVVLRPFSGRAFRAANRAIADWWWSLCVTIARRFNKVQVHVTGEELPSHENAIVLCNHQTMADIPVLFDLAWRHGRLGDLKWYVKDVLKYVPGIGWGMLFLDCLFVKRDWTADRNYIKQVFGRIVRAEVPVWVVTYAEGTRLTPAKAARSRKYAGEHGHPLFDHLLLPRTKGFVATVSGLEGHVQSIYDLTVGYHETVPSLWQWTKGSVPRVAVHVRRYPIAEVPTDSEACAGWLIERYAEKDRMLAEFYATGRFA